MRVHIPKKRGSKPFIKSSWTKEYHKNSYTIFKGWAYERHDERVKVEINVL